MTTLSNPVGDCAMAPTVIDHTTKYIADLQSCWGRSDNGPVIEGAYSWLGEWMVGA